MPRSARHAHAASMVVLQRNLQADEVDMMESKAPGNQLMPFSCYNIMCSHTEMCMLRA